MLCIANTHLFWNPSFPHVKCRQAHALLLECYLFLKNLEKKYERQIPIVICGDFNSLPNSQVYKLFVEGEVTMSTTKSTHKREIIVSIFFF